MSGWNLTLRFLGLGWYVGLSVVVGIVAGWLLDSRLNSSPVFLIVGTILGSGVAFYGMYRMTVSILQIADCDTHAKLSGDERGSQ